MVWGLLPDCGPFRWLGLIAKGLPPYCWKIRLLGLIAMDLLSGFVFLSVFGLYQWPE